MNLVINILAAVIIWLMLMIAWDLAHLAAGARNRRRNTWRRWIVLGGTLRRMK